MKRTFFLAILMLLVSAGFAKAQSFEQDLRDIFNNLHPRTKVEFDTAVLEGNQLIIKNIKITYTGKEPKAVDEDQRRQAELDSLMVPYVATVEEMLVENPNLELAATDKVALLADRITSRNIRVTCADWDMALMIKECQYVKPRGPWAQIIKMRNAELEQFVEQLLLIQTDSAQAEEISLVPVNKEHYGMNSITIASMDAKNLGVFNAEKITLRDFLMSDASDPQEYLKIASTELHYDVREPARAWVQNPHMAESDPIWLSKYKFRYGATLNSIKSSMDSLPFTIKRVVADNVNKNSLVSTFNLDAFRVENQDLKNAFLGKEIAQMLKGNPLLISCDGKSELKTSGLAPTTFNIRVDRMFNLASSAMVADNPNNSYFAIQAIDDIDDFMGNKVFLLDVLIKEATFRYEDKGLINGALDVMAEGKQMSREAMRQESLKYIDMMAMYDEDKLTKQFMAAMRKLISKPGTLTVKAVAPRPMPIEQIFNTYDQDGAIKYEFKVN